MISEIVTADPVRTQTFPGVIAGENSAVLGFLTGGRIATIPVTVGGKVAPGATLATLDQATLGQDLATARAALTAARAENTRAGLARAEDAAGYSTLTAPSSSIVLSVASEPGETVTSSAGVIELADLDGRNALIDVPEDFADLLPADALFTLQRHGQQDAPVPAVLTPIEPTTDTSLGTRRRRLTVAAPPEDYRIGSLVEVSYAPERTPVMTLPRVAIVSGDGSRRSGAWRGRIDASHGCTSRSAKKSATGWS